MSEGTGKGRKTSFEQKKGGRGSRITAGDGPGRRVVGSLKWLKILSVDEGEPTRGSVSEDGEKKGLVDRSEGLLGGAPRSGRNSSERSKTGIKRRSQSRTMREEGKRSV